MDLCYKVNKLKMFFFFSILDLYCFCCLCRCCFSCWPTCLWTCPCLPWCCPNLQLCLRRRWWLLWSQLWTKRKPGWICHLWKLQCCPSWWPNPNCNIPCGRRFWIHCWCSILWWSQIRTLQACTCTCLQACTCVPRSPCTLPRLGCHGFLCHVVCFLYLLKQNIHSSQNIKVLD